MIFYTSPTLRLAVQLVKFDFFCKVHIYVVYYVVCTCHTHVNIIICPLLLLERIN